jgi:hypothetical protein
MRRLTVREIVEALQLNRESHARDAAPHLDFVRACMRDDRFEVVGAVYDYLDLGRQLGTVTPSLPRDEFVAGLERFLERCLREDSSGEWVLTRYEAAWEIMRWFICLWKDESTEELARFKKWLARLYLTHDRDVANALTCGALEHIFENRKAMRYFKDWEKHPLLRREYKAAAVWGRAHPA